MRHGTGAGTIAACPSHHPVPPSRPRSPPRWPRSRLAQRPRRRIVSSRDPVNLALVRSPIDDSVFGLMPRGPVAMSDSWRRWRTRSHIGDNTADCVPCGPLSEYGLCTGALPDQVDEDDCGAHGATRRGTLVITVTDRGITVAGAPMPDLSACRDPRGGLIPVMTADARMPPLTIPDGTRKLLRMRVGQHLELKRRVVRGDCRRLRGAGLRTCSERVAIVKVTRFG